MFGVKDGELKEVIRYRKAHTRHSAVVWCPFCDYSLQLSVSAKCPSCGATMLTNDEAANYKIVPDEPIANLTGLKSEIAVAPEPEVVHDDTPHFGVYAKTVQEVKDILPRLNASELEALRAEEQVGKARISAIDVIDLAIRSRIAAIMPMDNGIG